MVIRRDEFNLLIDLLNERAETLNALLRNQDIQFQWIAQLQAELDLLKHPKLKKTWAYPLPTLGKKLPRPCAI
jgi:hypothetical protein